MRSNLGVLPNQLQNWLHAERQTLNNIFFIPVNRNLFSYIDNTQGLLTGAVLLSNIDLSFLLFIIIIARNKSGRFLKCNRARRESSVQANKQTEMLIYIKSQRGRLKLQPTGIVYIP